MHARHAGIRALAVLSLSLTAAGGFDSSPGDLPVTAAEASGFARTSTNAEVGAFLDALASLPHGPRLTRERFGTSGEGRALEVVRVAEPRAEGSAASGAGPRLRVVVNANIHSGEVEGKEAVLQILRELAAGEHGALLAHAELYFVPVYNADGNDRIRRSNRVSQNGPDGGVGERENAAGLDLNRDFVKAEAPETQGLLALLARVDPHLFVDLHTTNGTDHGYHLTYAPSLAPGQDPELARYAREGFLAGLRARMAERHGYRTFDYGNLARARPGGPPRWVTYDHRPRFGTNRYGLCNRLALLSEAYSYLAYPERVKVTRAFVLEALELAVRDRERIAELCAAADRRVVESEALDVAVDAALEPGVPFRLLLGEVAEVEVELEDGTRGTRRVATGETREIDAVAEVAFVATRDAGLDVTLDGGWIVVAPRAELLRTLEVHGITFARVERAARAEAARAFRISAAPKERRPFQGHLERRVEGEWVDAPLEVPAGALFVPRKQRFARLAAWLLEPESDDSLATWNAFDAEIDAALAAGEDGSPAGALHPVRRLVRGASGLALGGDR